MSWGLLIVAMGLLLIGWLALRRGSTLREESGLPLGRVVYADTEQWQTPNKPFYSERYHLTGKPDYLVQTPDGLIPVEVKSANAPDVPYWGHLLQLAAYCLLIEDTLGQTPPHGLLQYADATFELDYTPELREELLNTLAEMRASYRLESVSRSHEQANKCWRCGFYEQCDEAMAG